MTELKTYRIVKTEDTCRGAARFEGTVLPVWLLYGLYMQGGGDITPEARVAILETSYLPERAINDAVAYIKDNTEEIQRELLRTASLLSEVSSWMEVSDANRNLGKYRDRIEDQLVEERRKNKHLVDAIVTLAAENAMLREGDI